MIQKVVTASNDNSFLDPGQTARLEDGKLITAVKRSPPGVEVQAVMRCAPQRVFDLLTNYAEMPGHIFGLESADVLEHQAGATSVRFTMKLPFPMGRVEWSNLIQTRRLGDIYSIDWTLIDGDLEVNEGRLVMCAYRGQPEHTHARYTVRVQSRSGLPKSAERLATRWLLPKIVGKLRRVAENG